MLTKNHINKTTKSAVRKNVDKYVLQDVMDDMEVITSTKDIVRCDWCGASALSLIPCNIGKVICIHCGNISPKGGK